MKVLRRSGKVLFRRCRNNKNFTRAFTVEMDVIKQLGANGKEIGGKRSINPKAQDFEMTKLNKSAVLHGLKAVKLTAKAHFKAQKANLDVDIYILCQNGTIKFDDDEIVMKNGSLKLFLKVHTHFPRNLSCLIIYNVISVTRHHVGLSGSVNYFRVGTEWDDLKDLAILNLTPLDLILVLDGNRSLSLSELCHFQGKSMSQIYDTEKN